MFLKVSYIISLLVYGNNHVNNNLFINCIILYKRSLKSKAIYISIMFFFFIIYCFKEKSLLFCTKGLSNQKLPMLSCVFIQFFKEKSLQLCLKGVWNQSLCYYHVFYFLIVIYSKKSLQLCLKSVCVVKPTVLLSYVCNHVFYFKHKYTLVFYLAKKKNWAFLFKLFRNHVFFLLKTNSNCVKCYNWIFIF